MINSPATARGRTWFHFLTRGHDEHSVPPVSALPLPSPPNAAAGEPVSLPFMEPWFCHYCTVHNVQGTQKYWSWTCYQPTSQLSNHLPEQLVRSILVLPMSKVLSDSALTLYLLSGAFVFQAQGPSCVYGSPLRFILFPFGLASLRQFPILGPHYLVGK